MKHALVTLMPTAALPAAIAAALASGSASVHVHADMAGSKLDLAMQAVEPADEHRVAIKSWPTGAAPEPLLNELGEPDAWLELGWLYNRRSAVPPLAAPTGDSTSVQEHEQAFDQWAQARLAGLDADDLAELDDIYGPGLTRDADDLEGQPDGDTADWRGLGLPLMLEGEMVAPPAGQALAARAADRPDPKQWQLKLRWQCRTRGRLGSGPQLNFEAVLLAQPSAYAPTDIAALKLELRLDPDEWRGAQDIQAWLYPHLQQPILLGLGDAVDGTLQNEMLVLQAPVPVHAGLVDALRGTHIAVSLGAEEAR